jgi:methylated-DNA-[protein]-cysteine S-methyltransferase
MTLSFNHQHAHPQTPVCAALADCDDPCEVVEEAIPVMVIGDLERPDEAAIVSHCAYCRSCADQLATWETGLAEPPPPAVEERPVPARALGLKAAHYGLMESPVGDLLIVVTDDGVADVSYLANRDREELFSELEERGILASERASDVVPVREQLEEYFGHHRTTFSLPVDLTGLTPFTQQVLKATSHVPFGQVSTYQGIASAIGRPSATRAVGNALGRNPVPVIVPCHRVVRSDGSMGWYTGGAHIKERLLDIEGVRFAAAHRAQPALPGLR